MRSLVHAALLFALAAPAIAQEPTEEQKIDALKRAYHINGDSMVGWGSIDMTIPRKIITERVAPDGTIDPKDLNAVDQAVDRWPATDICSQHGLRKVLTDGGKSWHCKK